MREHRRELAAPPAPFFTCQQHRALCGSWKRRELHDSSVRAPKCGGHASHAFGVSNSRAGHALDCRQVSLSRRRGCWQASCHVSGSNARSSRQRRWQLVPCEKQNPACRTAFDCAASLRHGSGAKVSTRLVPYLCSHVREFGTSRANACALCKHQPRDLPCHQNGLRRTSKMDLNSMRWAPADCAALYEAASWGQRLFGSVLQRGCVMISTTLPRRPAGTPPKETN